jgi:hypothetical protein
MEKRGPVLGAVVFYGGFMSLRLLSLTAAEKAFLDDALIFAERAAGKKLSRPEKNVVLNRAREQIKAQRYAETCRAERDQERQAAEFTWNKPKPFRR